MYCCGVLALVVLIRYVWVASSWDLYGGREGRSNSWPELTPQSLDSDDKRCLWQFDAIQTGVCGLEKMRPNLLQTTNYSSVASTSVACTDVLQNKSSMRPSQARLSDGIPATLRPHPAVDIMGTPNMHPRFRSRRVDVTAQAGTIASGLACRQNACLPA